MAKLQPRIENLTGTLLIIRDGPDGTLKIPPKGEVDVSGLNETLKRLEEQTPKVIKIKFPRRPNGRAVETESPTTDDAQGEENA